MQGYSQSVQLIRLGFEFGGFPDHLLSYFTILSAHQALLESIPLIAGDEVEGSVDSILGIKGEDIRMNELMGG